MQNKTRHIEILQQTMCGGKLVRVKDKVHASVGDAQVLVGFGKAKYLDLPADKAAHLNGEDGKVHHSDISAEEKKAAEKEAKAKAKAEKAAKKEAKAKAKAEKQSGQESEKSEPAAESSDESSEAASENEVA